MTQAELFTTSALSTAYCAGLFDGEGCITISRHARRDGPVFALTLRLVMTNEGGVRRFRELVGRGTLRYQATRDDVRLPSWVWTLSRAGSIGTVLTSLRPHLVVKAAEADLALRFLRTRSTSTREQLWIAARACKTKGRGLRRAA